MMRIPSNTSCWLAALTAGLVAFAAPVAAQHETDPTDLRRDQDEIIRKSQRLRELMQSLVERYRNEGRAQQVKLLENGLRHLEESGLLEDVAGIRDRLRDRALTEALRKQGEVVENLERLLAILRDRESVENLEREIEATTRMAEQADELVRRQAELQEQTREAVRGEPSAAEQALLDQLSDLARQQRAESRENAHDAGLRAPILEDALRRVAALLGRQDTLEKRAEGQLEGGVALPESVRQESFELGALEEAQRELFEATARSRAMERAAEAARDVREALERDDAEALQQAMSRLQSRLETAATRAAPEDGPRLEEWQKIGALDPDERAQLGASADEIAKGAAERAQKLGTAAEANRGQLEQRLRETARQLDRGETRKPGSAAEATEEAARALAEAARLAEAGRDAESIAKMSEASRALAEARDRHRSENPDARQIASEMGAEASQVAAGLRRAPPPMPGEEPRERQAADALESADEALRDAARQLAPENPEAPERADVQRGLGASRSALEQARDQLQQALDAETGGREAQLAQRAARQRELEARAQALREQLGQGDNGLSPEQRQAAEPALEQAQELMRQARESLEQGGQSNAAENQGRAADKLDQATEAIERNRPLDPEQQQALQQLAEQQKQLEEDIIRLAKLVEERQNRAAQQALDQAAKAAGRAQQEMQEGDQQETAQQQEEARQRLEEARDALEEERDRYQDLRQEELLFRIQDELVDFLERQRPITQSTQEAGESLDGQPDMTRIMRRKLNGFGQQEKELSAKAEYLRTALEEEGTLVFSHALKNNEEDLTDISQRLSGRHPDAGPLTVMLQQDVETRTTQLLEALRREQERRQREGSGGQSQQPGENQRAQPRLVPVLAELQMLKQMEQDMQARTEQMQKLVEGRAADGITELEVTLIERLAHRHNAVTEIFLQLKAQLEEAMQPPQEGEGTPPEQGEGGKGKESGR